MRIGVYNRIWRAGGGAERCSAAIAGILSRDHQVEILGRQAVDLPDLSFGLGLDLERARFRRVPPVDECELAVLTRDYDLFVNCALQSRLPSSAKKSVYLVQLPRKPWPLGVVRAGQWLVRSLAAEEISPVVPLEGFYERDPTEARWSRGRALLRVQPWAFRRATARVRLCPPASRSLRETILDVEAARASWRIEHDELILDRLDPTSDEPVDIGLECRTFVPQELGLSPDRRRLGVRLPEQRPPGWWPSARRLVQSVGGRIAHHDLRIPRSYDLLLAISERTQRRIAELWDRPSEVLAPPVDTSRFRAPRSEEKQRIILSVSCFLRRDGARSLKEMLRTFRTLVDRGTIPEGWHYHVAGDLPREHLEDLEDFAELERLAEGYPVTLVVDPDLDRLAQECRCASILWLAPNWLRPEPDRPAEPGPVDLTLGDAMSAGCIPIVGAGEDSEGLVKHGENGFLFTTAAELSSITMELTRAYGEPRASALMRQASASVQRFALPCFESRLREILSTHGVLS